MAAASLGRLTLDLAVKLGSFEQGMTQAERRTKDTTEKMGKAFGGFKSQVADALGGTQIGSIVDSFNAKIGSLKGGAMVAGAAFAGMAVGGIAVAFGALSKMAIETAKADAQLLVLANRANTSAENFQILQYAASGLGVTQDQLGSILADVQEKLGEFSATKGGGAADFFDALKNNTKMTDKEIKNFSKTLQGKDGVEAVQLLKNKLDEVGASSQEQRFVFESLGSDLGNLLPLFANGGSLLDEYGKALQDAGVIKSKEAIQQSQILAAQAQAVNLQFQGAKSQLVQGFMPAIVSVSDAMFGTSKNGVQLATVGDGLGTVFKILATLALGASHVIQQVGNAFGAVAAMAVAAAKRDFASVVAIYEDSEKRVDDINSDMLDRYSKVWEPVTESSNTLVNALQSISNATTDSSTGLKVNTKEAEENAKAKEAAAKATAKAAKEQENLNKIIGAAEIKSLGLRLKSSETISGGGVKAYTAQFAKMAQDALGEQLHRFTALNDGYHQGKGGKHPVGQAFDFTVQDAARADESIKRIQELAKKYGFTIKTLNEYSDPSKKATGGHIHVSVLGYKGTAQALKDAQALVGIAAEAQDEIGKAQLSVVAKYATVEQKMAADHAENIKAIKIAFIEGDPSRQKYLDLQQGIYDRDVSAYKQAQKEKYDSYRNDFLSKMADAEDAISLSSIANKYGKGALEFQVASLNVSARKSKAGEYDDYTNSVNQINRDYNTPELETQRYKLLEDAKAAHIANLKAMDIEYHDSTKQLVDDFQRNQYESQMNTYSSMLSAAQGTWGTMTSMIRDAQGEQSGIYKAMFFVQQSMAAAQAIIYANVASAAALAPPPIGLGPVAGIPLSTMLKLTGYANAGLIMGQAIAGVFHGGVDYVPKESSYFLDKGERVLSPRQNSDLTRYLNNQKQGNGNGTNVIINVPAGYTANESRDGNGNVTIDVVEKVVKQAFGNLNQANSFESKQIRNNFNVGRAR